MKVPDLNTCHFGNNLETMRSWPDAFVQTCVTPPPYLGLRNYGVPPSDWPTVEFSILGIPYSVPAMTCCLGLESTWQAFIGHLVLIMREVRRVLRDDGTLWLNLGDSFAGSWGAQGRQGKSSQMLRRSAAAERQIAAAAKKQSGTGSIPKDSDLKPKDMMGIPWLAAFALRSDGWYLRQDVIWSKPNPMPESVQDRCTKAHEYVFLLSKAPDYFFDTVAIAEPVSYTERPGEKPTWASASMMDDGRSKRSGNKARKYGEDRDGPEENGSNQGSSIPWEGSTRQKRDVWTIATEPTSFDHPAVQHFATFPRALVQPCVLAGASSGGACGTCRAPYIRQVEKTFHAQPDTSPERAVRGADGQKPLDESNGKDGYTRGIVKKVTTGWAPSCKCGDPTVIPCVVLDPFLGSGTTGEVCQGLGRDWLGCDINPKYGSLQGIRTQKMGLL